MQARRRRRRGKRGRQRETMKHPGGIGAPVVGRREEAPWDVRVCTRGGACRGDGQTTQGTQEKLGGGVIRRVELREFF